MSIFATLSNLHVPSVSSSASVHLEYLVCQNNQATISTTVLLVDVNLLHQRLSHLALHTLKTVTKHCNASAGINKTQNFCFCNACQFGKNHLQHFGSIETNTIAPLQLLYADL